ncbi:MAG: hypothetical protein HZA51_12065 [Planctomycetes bacterium]|nr:hypothetical protein [Planctomycetota bacterium]
MNSSSKRSSHAFNARAATIALAFCAVGPAKANPTARFWCRVLAVLLLGLSPAVANAGIVFFSGDDADDVGHCTGSSCGGLYPAVFSFSVANSASPGTGILAIGVNGGQAASSLASWNNPANGGPGATVTILTNPAMISTVAFTDFAVLYIPSVDLHTSGGLTQVQLNALNTRQADIVDFVNDFGGAIIALTEAEKPNAYGWLPIPVQTADRIHTNVCPTAALTTALAPAATCANMSHNFYHTVFTGPPGFLGLDILATSTDSPVGDVVLLGGADVLIGGQITLSPRSAMNPIGTSHTLTAMVLELLPPNNPIANTLVTFDVLSGPNAGTTGTATTNLNGIAMFTYNGVDVAGVDQIQASFVDSNGTSLSNIVTKEWVVGQITLSQGAATASLCTDHSITANTHQSLDPFSPLAGELVNFNVITGPNAGAFGTSITNASGNASFTYTGMQLSGTDQIQASFEDGGQTVLSNILAVAWSPSGNDCNLNGIPDECEQNSGCCQLDSDCDDGLFCNGIEKCVSGQCVPGVPVECDDMNGLTLDCCDEGLADCVHTPIGNLRISRVVVNSGDNSRPVGGGYRLSPNVAEAVLSKDAVADTWLTNSHYRLRVGFLVEAADCNGNGVHDSIDIECGAPDCNGNGIPDSCDVLVGGDTNGNGIPDICEPLSCATCPGDTSGNNKTDGGDVQKFAECLFAFPNVSFDCACADMNNDHQIGLADVELFVQKLLGIIDADPACP